VLSPAPPAAHEYQHQLGWLRKYIFSTDHKVIGIQYAISSFLFLLLDFI
jgi:cytochrome c oxidase subunit 1